MELLPIRTAVLKEGDDLARAITDHADLQNGDIIVISAKAVATVEGAAISITQNDAAFREAVSIEAARLNGGIVGECPEAFLTELRPDGMPHGTILAANAGLDRSNVPGNFVIGWPKDPVRSVQRLRTILGNDKAIILSDSSMRPRRLGVTAQALVVSGIDPVVSQIGRKDLFGRPLRMTHEAVADQLATAANYLMGNADQSMPAVLIRGHGLPFSTFEGWVPGIDPEQDLFRPLL